MDLEGVAAMKSYSEILSQVEMASEITDQAITDANEWLNPIGMKNLAKVIREGFSEQADWLEEQADSLMAAVARGDNILKIGRSE